MILTKVKLNDEETRQYDELEEIIKHLTQGFRECSYQEREQRLILYRETADKQHAIEEAAEQRYIASIIGDYDTIMGAVKEILAAFTKKDYREFISEMRAFTRAEIALSDQELKDAQTEEEKKIIAEKRKQQKETYSNFFSYNFESVREQLQELTSDEATALVKSNFSLDEYNKLINEKAASFYAPRRGKQQDIAVIEPVFEEAFLPMLNGPLINDMLQISRGAIKPDPRTNIATFTTREGRKITIENADKIKSLSVSMHKILHAAVARLTSTNYYNDNGKNSTVNPIVEIPLMEYGEKNLYQLAPRSMGTLEEQDLENTRAKERRKKFKQDLGRDLSDWEKFSWSGEETKGKNAGNHRSFRIFSSHDITDEKIEIRFDAMAAIYLMNTPLMQYPSALFRHDNRKPTAYTIGFKLALHNSIDNNYIAGTANTLSVNSLLEAAPEIPRYEDIIARGQRNWKDKVKRPLETALDENITIGLLSKWEYRDPKTGKTYTSETAQPLTWPQYSRLMVDFIIIDAPEQTERRATRALEKATALEKAAALGKSTEPTKRKRGRPRKTSQEK